MRNFVLCIGLCCLLATVCIPHRTPCLPIGERYTFYLEDSHSGASFIISDHPHKDKLLLPNITGESCELKTSDYQKILQNYGATVIFYEEVANICNYYAYTPQLPYRLTIDGKTVNLHIAVRSDRICVGTPIIFGGY